MITTEFGLTGREREEVFLHGTQSGSRWPRTWPHENKSVAGGEMSYCQLDHYINEKLSRLPDSLLIYRSQSDLLPVNLVLLL